MSTVKTAPKGATTAKTAVGTAAATSTAPAFAFSAAAVDRGPQSLDEGDHVVTLDSVAFIEKAPSTDEYTDPTPQLEIVCKDTVTGRKMKYWPNLVGYKRFDELTEEDTNSIDPKALNIKAIEWKAMKFEDRKNAAFTSSERDGYAVSAVTGTRVLDAKRTEDAQAILGKAALHTGAAEEGQVINSIEEIMDMLSGATVGIHVSPNAQGKMRVEYTKPADQVEIAEEI
jgi:hypothetical protein